MGPFSAVDKHCGMVVMVLDGIDEGHLALSSDLGEW